jgi:hypothetical protein
MSEPLMIKCRYRAEGIQCSSGLLYDSVTLAPILLDGTGVYCPACEGRGMLPTPKGREFLAFLEKFGRSQLRDIVDELFGERG